MKFRISGFTIIELLAILSISIVLIFLISIFLRSSYKKSIALQCTNRLKNLHTLSVLYFQEHSALINGEDLLHTLAVNDLESIKCPGARNALTTEYMVWQPCIDLINSEKNFFPAESKILFIDPHEKTHGNYALGILNIGKIIHVFTEKSSIRPPGNNIAPSLPAIPCSVIGGKINDPVYINRNKGFSWEKPSINVNDK